MKKYDYYRPSASSLGRKKKIRKKPSLSFFKSIAFFFVFIGLCFAAYVGVSKAYQVFFSSRLSHWQPSAVVIDGVDGVLVKQIQTETNDLLNKEFSVSKAVSLQSRLSKKYPQLRQISVKRGLLSGKLKITAKRRKPVAKFLLPDKSIRFIDQDSTVYSDPNPDPLSTVPYVELAGMVPDNLGEEFVDLVESSLKLKDQLDFAFLHFDPSKDTVRMHMPDGCVINFGPAKKLRQKARRAAQIEKIAKKGYPHPHELDFTYFDDGKVFLRQTAH